MPTSAPPMWDTPGYMRKKHNWVDFIAGAAIGVASNFYFTEPYKGMEISTIADGDIYGIQISKHW